MEGLLKGAGESTNYWDILVFSGVTTALGVSTVGGITALATDIECDVPKSDSVAVCCARAAPPPLIPIVALVCALIMFGMVWVRRLDVKTFQAFRSKFHVAAADYAKEHDGDKKEVLKQGILDMLPHSAGTVSRTIPVLRSWARWQLVVAMCLVLVATLVLGLVLGWAVVVGGKLAKYEYPGGGSYYDFECPSSCSVLTAPPTAVPTDVPTASPTLPTFAPTATPTILGAPTTAQLTLQPTVALTTTLPPTTKDHFDCRIKPESPGLFLTLMGALALCVVGSLKFKGFIFGLGKHKDSALSETQAQMVLTMELEPGIAEGLIPITPDDQAEQFPQRNIQKEGEKFPQEEDENPSKPINVCSPRWESYVLFDYATGDERDLSVRVFRADMKLSVDVTFQQFGLGKKRIHQIEKLEAKIRTTLAQLYFVWENQWMVPGKEPPVDFSSLEHRLKYNDIMRSLNLISVNTSRLHALLNHFEGNPATAVVWKESHVHDGKRMNILRIFQKNLGRLETQVTNVEGSLWSNSTIDEDDLKASAFNDYLLILPSDAPANLGTGPPCT